MPHTFFFLMSFLVAAQAYIWNYVFALSLWQLNCFWITVKKSQFIILTMFTYIWQRLVIFEFYYSEHVG